MRLALAYLAGINSMTSSLDDVSKRPTRAIVTRRSDRQKRIKIWVVRSSSLYNHRILYVKEVTIFIFFFLYRTTRCIITQTQRDGIVKKEKKKL